MILDPQARITPGHRGESTKSQPLDCQGNPNNSILIIAGGNNICGYYCQFLFLDSKSPWLYIWNFHKASSPYRQFQRWCRSSTMKCPALCIPMDCSQPAFSVHGISQARMLVKGVIQNKNCIEKFSETTSSVSPDGLDSGLLTQQPHKETLIISIMAVHLLWEM